MMCAWKSKFKKESWRFTDKNINKLQGAIIVCMLLATCGQRGQFYRHLTISNLDLAGARGKIIPIEEKTIREVVGDGVPISPDLTDILKFWINIVRYELVRRLREVSKAEQEKKARENLARMEQQDENCGVNPITVFLKLNGAPLSKPSTYIINYKVPTT
jgi:hypothetical protein